MEKISVLMSKITTLESANLSSAQVNETEQLFTPSVETLSSPLTEVTTKVESTGETIFKAGEAIVNTVEKIHSV